MVVFALTTTAALGAASTQPAATAPASAPATRPALAAYQPGVSIDWAARQVQVVGEVVLRSGELELFACSPGTKEHESIVRVLARPLHIYQALGLLGFEAGHPPYYDNDQKKTISATGEQLGVFVRWTEDGRPRLVPVEAWMYDKKRNAPPGPIDWVFAGSLPTEDGRVLADYEGTVLCVVDFAGAIVCPSASHSPDNAELWLVANTAAIPPARTPVTLIFQAAGPRLLFHMDRFGQLRQDGRPISVRQLILAARQAGPGATAVLRHDAALPHVQVRELVRALEQAGLDRVAAEAQPAETCPSAANGGGMTVAQDDEAQGQPLMPTGGQGSPCGWWADLQPLADLGRQLPAAVDTLARSVQDRCRAVSERLATAARAAAGMTQALVSFPATQSADR